MTGSFRYKVLAVDVDGTLLTSAQQVTPELREALARLAGLSVRTVLCTGRRWRSALRVLDGLDHVHPVVVCASGALVKRADDQATLYAVPMREDTAQRALAAYRRRGLVPMLVYDVPLSERDVLVAEEDKARAEQLGYTRMNADTIAYFCGDCPVSSRGPLGIYSVDEPRVILAAAADVRSELNGVAIVDDIRLAGGAMALEAHDPSATKWNALAWLLAQWGVEASEVVAVGDDMNDIPMLRSAGRSFAMGHAPAAVRAAAGAVTASNDEHGVVQALATAFQL